MSRKRPKIFLCYLDVGYFMATNKRVFTLRLSDEVFEKIGVLATREHRSITNFIEYVLLKHLEEEEARQGEIKIEAKEEP